MFKNFFSIKANIRKLYVISGLKTALFMMPILFLYYQNYGLTVNDIFILQSIYSLSVVLLEIPSGYIADIFSKKTSIILGIALTILGVIFYTIGYGFWRFLAAEVIRGFGNGFISGADSAILYETLKNNNEENQYKKISGRTNSIGSFSESIGSIIGGLVFVISMKLPFILYLITLVGSLFISMTIVEPPVHEKLDKKDNPWLNILKIVKYSLHGHKEIKWLIIYSGLVGASTLTAVRFIQPFFKEIGLSSSRFGILRAALNASVAIFFLFAHIYEKKLGRKLSLISLILLSSLGFFVIGLQQSLFTLPFIFIFYFLRSVNSPVIDDYINKIIPSNIRATVLSVRSMVGRLIFAMLGPIVGWMTDVFSFGTALILCGIIFLTLGSVSLLFLHKHKAL